VNARVWKIAPLLFGSGFCALVYQTAWQRELRLIFGASTAASAAVLAIFMGGLGLGGDASDYASPAGSMLPDVVRRRRPPRWAGHCR